MEGLRSLGLTLAEIVELTEVYLHQAQEPVGPRLAAVLAAVRERTERQIGELRDRLERITAYEQDNTAALSGRQDLRDQDPRLGRDPRP